VVKKRDSVQQYQEEQEQEVASSLGTAGEVGIGRLSVDGPVSGHQSLALVDHREGSGGERSEPELPGRGATSAAADVSKTSRPDPEVVPQAKRRRFSAKYKLDILNRTDALADTGKVGALLRREGLYYTHLTTWRRQREEGGLAGLTPKRRGPKPDPDREVRLRVAQLEKENRRLADRLEKAELIIDVQKKISRILGIEQPPYEREGKE
jgi:transposase